MSTYNTENMGPYIVTVKQFGNSFLPVLLDNLVKEYHFQREDALLVGKSVLKRLEWKFSDNKRQPVQVFQEAISNIVTRETNKYRRLMEKNFGLSKDAFNEMIEKMQNGDESLFEVVFLSHFEFCLSYIQAKYNASYENAYDSSMNAMLSFCRGLKEGTISYGNLQFLFTQMAGQFYFKWIRKEKPKESLEGIDIPEEEDSFDEANLNTLDKAWNLLGKECRQLLENFYYRDDQLREIAKKHEKSPSAMRKQKQRCIEKLREYFIQMNH